MVSPGVGITGCALFLPIELQPNAGGEPRPMAEATQERTLLGVGSTAWFDAVCWNRLRYALSNPDVSKTTAHSRLVLSFFPPCFLPT